MIQVEAQCGLGVSSGARECDWISVLPGPGGGGEDGEATAWLSLSPFLSVALCVTFLCLKIATFPTNLILT